MYYMQIHPNDKGSQHGIHEKCVLRDVKIQL